MAKYAVQLNASEVVSNTLKRMQARCANPWCYHHHNGIDRTKPTGHQIDGAMRAHHWISRPLAAGGLAGPPRKPKQS
jgi:hypothetical protein